MENIQIYSVLLLSAGTLGSVTQYMLSPQNLQTSDSSPPKSSITPIMFNLNQKPFRFLHGFLTKNSFFAMSPRVNKYMELMLK